MDLMENSGIFVLGFMIEDIVPHVSFSPNPMLQGIQSYPCDTDNSPLSSQSARSYAEISTAHDAGTAMPLQER